MMPSLRKKVAGFIRQLSVTNQSENAPAGQYDGNVSSSGCFIQRYLSGHDVRGTEPVILHGRNPQELPAKCLGTFATGTHSIVATATGPDGGLTTVNLRQRHFSTSDPDVDYIDILDQQADHESNTDLMSPTHAKTEEIAGVCDWFCPHKDAFGAATTLYERHPITNENAGNPIADCFAVVARENSAILALADGVNWGEKACVAARSAIHGCVEYLNKALFTPGVTSVSSTTDVFVALLRSFHAAHSLILQEEGMLTTLTAAVVLPLKTSENYIVCVCNVGDSLAYVYSQEHGVREITKGSHDIHCMRDMRDALGALGPVDGQNPELNNLTCSMTEVEEGDIVFVTSDGVSDNFDPVVGKFAVLPPSQQNEASTVKINNPMKMTSNPSRQQASNSRTPGSSDSTLPTVEAYQRHELSLLRMDDLLKNGVSGNGPPCGDAKTLCEMLLDFAVRLTAAKRHILEDPDLYYTVSENSNQQIMELSRTEQRTRRKKVCEKLAMVPGKLDHATVVAYKVGVHEKSSNFLPDNDKKLPDDVLLETNSFLHSNQICFSDLNKDMMSVYLFLILNSISFLYYCILLNQIFYHFYLKFLKKVELFIRMSISIRGFINLSFYPVCKEFCKNNINNNKRSNVSASYAVVENNLICVCMKLACFIHIEKHKEQMYLNAEILDSDNFS
ncbi:PP2C-like domain-containing protein CG9801, partial [Gryllus bimaculatus]